MLYFVYPAPPCLAELKLVTVLNEHVSSRHPIAGGSAWFGELSLTMPSRRRAQGREPGSLGSGRPAIPAAARGREWVSQPQSLCHPSDRGQLPHNARGRGRRRRYRRVDTSPLIAYAGRSDCC